MSVAGRGLRVRPTRRPPPPRPAALARRTLLFLAPAAAAVAAPAAFEPMEGLKGKDYGKSRTRLADYELDAETGLQYKDFVVGTGDGPAAGGDMVTVDWDGYTLGER